MAETNDPRVEVGGVLLTPIGLKMMAALTDKEKEALDWAAVAACVEQYEQKLRQVVEIMKSLQQENAILKQTIAEQDLQLFHRTRELDMCRATFGERIGIGMGAGAAPTHGEEKKDA